MLMKTSFGVFFPDQSSFFGESLQLVGFIEFGAVSLPFSALTQELASDRQAPESMTAAQKKGLNPTPNLHCKKVCRDPIISQQRSQLEREGVGDNFNSSYSEAPIL